MLCLSSSRFKCSNSNCDSMCRNFYCNKTREGSSMSCFQKHCQNVREAIAGHSKGVHTLIKNDVMVSNGRNGKRPGLRKCGVCGGLSIFKCSNSNCNCKGLNFYCNEPREGSSLSCFDRYHEDMNEEKEIMCIVIANENEERLRNTSAFDRKKNENRRKKMELMTEAEVKECKEKWLLNARLRRAAKPKKSWVSATIECALSS